ncbi:hypothetical protein PHDIMM138B_07095 [Phytobacter diazotrophicus]
MKKIGFRIAITAFTLVTPFYLNAASKSLSAAQNKIVSNSIAAKEMGCKKFVSWFPEEINKKTKFTPTKSVLNTDKLIAGSSVYCMVNASVDSSEASIFTIERGEVDGTLVDINHSNGTATIGEGSVFDNQGWDVACKRDEFSDEKSCYARQYGLTIRKINNGYFIYIGNDLTPGGKVELRLDKTEALSSADGNGMLKKQDTDLFLKHVKKDSKVIVRYTIFPKQTPEVRTIDTKTLGAAIIVMDMIDKSFL